MRRRSADWNVVRPAAFSHELIDELEDMFFKVPMIFGLNQVHIGTHQIDGQQIALQRLPHVLAEHDRAVHARSAGRRAGQAGQVALSAAASDQDIGIICLCLGQLVLEFARLVAAQGQRRQVITFEIDIQIQFGAQVREVVQGCGPVHERKFGVAAERRFDRHKAILNQLGPNHEYPGQHQCAGSQFAQLFERQPVGDLGAGNCCQRLYQAKMQS